MRWLFIFVMLVPFAAGAATFEYRELPDTPQDWKSANGEIVLDGPIVAGDAEQFLAFYDQVQGVGKRLRIRLNSPGGSLDAGIAIAEAVKTRGISTYVGFGDRCMSACALIFMSGSHHEGDSSFSKLRIMHHLAIVGFHAPAAFGQNQTAPAAAGEVFLADVEKASRLASASLVQFSVDGRIPTDLLEELLQVDPQDFLLIDTVDRAGRWDIRIENEMPLRKLGAAQSQVYCTNLFHWQNTIAFENRKPGASIYMFSNDGGKSYVNDGMNFECRLSVQQSDKGPTVILGRGYPRVNAWQAFPAQTPLALLGSDAVAGASGPTFEMLTSIPANPRATNFAELREVKGDCTQAGQWTAGWRKKQEGSIYDGSVELDYTKANESYAYQSGCGAWKPGVGMTCAFGGDAINLRLDYDTYQTPNQSGQAFADIDGQQFSLQGQNGKLLNDNWYVSIALPRNSPFLDILKRGTTLTLFGNGPNLTVPLQGSARAIEVMQLSCR